MKPNKIQTTIGIACGIITLALVIFPPWQEAAEREVSYRKDIGRGFLWHRPKPVAVDCYFAGCVTAPASYFRVQLNRELLLQETLALVFVGIALLWTFRSRRDGTIANLHVRATRLLISCLLALLIPPTKGVPLGAALAGIPRMVLQRDELWLFLTTATVVMYIACVVTIYFLLTIAVWHVARRVPQVRARS